MFLQVQKRLFPAIRVGNIWAVQPGTNLLGLLTDMRNGGRVYDMMRR